MMTEENTVAEQGQEAVSIEQDTDDRDYKDLYLQEIKQHKKARARAQMAEEKNQTFTDKDEKARKERSTNHTKISWSRTSVFLLEEGFLYFSRKRSYPKAPPLRL